MSTKNNMGTIDDSDFVSVVSESEKPVLVFFHAEWSGISHAMFPTLESIATEFASDLDVRSANADLNKDSIARIGVRKAPTCAMFKSGTLIGLRAGPVTRENLRKFVSESLEQE